MITRRLISRKPTGILLILLIGSLLILHGFVAPASAADVAIAYVDPYDVSIVVNNDGSFDVTEFIQVWSQSGTLAGGDRWLPTDATEGVTLVRLVDVSTGIAFTQIDYSTLSSKITISSDRIVTTKIDGTGWFSIRTTSGDNARIEIDFIFPRAIPKGKFIPLELSYHASGALRGYPSRNPPVQQLWWKAIGQEFSKSVYVARGSVTVTLPKSVPLASVKAAHNGTDDIAPTLSTDGKTFLWSFKGLPRDEGFEVRLQFPWIATDAQVPAWQIEMDEANEHEQWLHLVLLILGLGTAGIGGASMGVWWYSRGRDPHTGIIATEITEPPSSLPPALAGTLLDENVDVRDIVSILLSLQKRGVVEIARRSGTLLDGVERWNPEQYFKLSLTPGEISVPDRIVLESIFGKPLVEGTEKSISVVGSQLLVRFPEIRDAVYRDLVDRKLMVKSPRVTRQRWRLAGTGLILLGLAVGFVGVVLEELVTLVPFVALVALGGAMFGFSKAMPQKTRKGAEEAAKWRAFQRYLRNVRRFGEDSPLETYLPYTISLGVNSVWVNQVILAGKPTRQTWWDRATDIFEGEPVLDGDWGGSTVLWTPSPYVGHPVRTGGSPWPGDPSFGVPSSLGEASDKALGSVGRASKETSGLLTGLGILLEIGSIFLGGGHGGGGGGGSFHS